VSQLRNTVKSKCGPNTEEATITERTIHPSEKTLETVESELRAAIGMHERKDHNYGNAECPGCALVNWVRQSPKMQEVIGDHLKAIYASNPIVGLIAEDELVTMLLVGFALGYKSGRIEAMNELLKDRMGI
jgi:hypothetical protein